MKIYWEKLAKDVLYFIAIAWGPVLGFYFMYIYLTSSLKGLALAGAVLGGMFEVCVYGGVLRYTDLLQNSDKKTTGDGSSDC